MEAKKLEVKNTQLFLRRECIINYSATEIQNSWNEESAHHLIRP